MHKLGATTFAAGVLLAVIAMVLALTTSGSTQAQTTPEAPTPKTTTATFINTNASHLIYLPRSEHRTRKELYALEINEAREGYKLYAIAGERDANLYREFAAWNGHQFEVVKGSIRFSYEYDEYHPDDKHDHEATFTLFHPIDQRTEADDWEGAIAAYPNETNTAWLPRRASKGYHHDHEDRLWAAVVTRFHPIISETLISVVVANNDIQRRDAPNHLRVAAGLPGRGANGGVGGGPNPPPRLLPPEPGGFARPGAG